MHVAASACVRASQHQYHQCLCTQKALGRPLPIRACGPSHASPPQGAPREFPCWHYDVSDDGSLDRLMIHRSGKCRGPLRCRIQHQDTRDHGIWDGVGWDGTGWDGTRRRLQELQARHRDGVDGWKRLREAGQPTSSDLQRSLSRWHPCCLCSVRMQGSKCGRPRLPEFQCLACLGTRRA